MTNRLDDRRARRKEQRAAARGQVRPGPATLPGWLLPSLVVGALVVAGVIAFLLPSQEAPTGGSSSVPPATAQPSGGASQAASGETAGVPVITGAKLPDFAKSGSDAAVGMAAPEVTGTDFAGNTVKIARDGRPKAILFIAHWCPHCQAEVPVVEAWVKAGGVPSGVDLISVATSIRPDAPNYPPDAWLQREGWTVPVIADTTNSVAGVYGLTFFPYWVYVGPDGNVRGRAVGELPVDQLQSTLQGLIGG
jgi:cytochrome c biogenesis protein CcmG, thiol:disulfide interchange protein DsbE